MTAALLQPHVSILMETVTLMTSAPWDSDAELTIAKDLDLTTPMIAVTLVTFSFVVKMKFIVSHMHSPSLDMDYLMANPGGMIAGVQIPDFSAGGLFF